MISTHTNSDLLTRTDKYLKIILSGGGITYALGFITVSMHLSRWEIYPVNLLRIQYILAGIWVIIPLLAVLFISFLAGSQFLKEMNTLKFITSPISEILGWLGKKFFYVTVLLIVAGLIIYLINYTSFYFLFDGFDPIGLNSFIKIFGYCFGLVLGCLASFLSFSNKGSESDRLSIREICFGGVFTGITIIIFMSYLAFFAFDIYRSVPADIGGGQPTTIRVMIEENENMGQIKQLIGIKDTLPFSQNLDMLFATDESYFIAHPEVEAASIEIPKELVSIAIFGSSE